MRLSATNNNQFNPGVVESNSPIGHLANNWWNVTASLQSPPPHPPPLSHHYQFAGMKISILSPPERENELTWHYLSKFTSALTNCHFPNHFFSVSFSSSILASLQGRNPYLEEKKNPSKKITHCTLAAAILLQSRQQHAESLQSYRTRMMLRSQKEDLLSSQCVPQRPSWGSLLIVKAVRGNRNTDGTRWPPVSQFAVHSGVHRTANRKCQRASSHLKALGKA